MFSLEEIFCDDKKYIFGWADLTKCIPSQFRETPFALSIGYAIDSRIINLLHGGPTVEYLNHYQQINQTLTQVVNVVTEILRQKGAVAIPVMPTISEEDLEKMRHNLRYFFSHKMAATRAGLGWIGKTDLFVSEKFGPGVRLATVLTNKLFGKIGTPYSKSFCGACTHCVEACPAKAASGVDWYAGLDRDEFFNAWKCWDMCKKLSMQKLGKSISICGICIAACPIGKGF